MYKVFRGCSVKEKRKGNQRLEATSRKFKRANDSKSISAPIRQKSPLFSNPFPKTFLSSANCAYIIFVLEATLARVLGHQICLTTNLRDTYHSDCHHWYWGRGSQNVELSKDHSIAQKKKIDNFFSLWKAPLKTIWYCLTYSLTNDESQKDGWTYLSSWVTTYARALQLPLKLR